MTGNAHRSVPHLTVDAVRSARAMETLDAELRASEERYRTLFDLVPVAVYSCDASGVIQAFNRRAAELWGREPAPGDTDERFCGSFKMFRPDGSFMPHDVCPMAQVLRRHDQEDAFQKKVRELMARQGIRRRRRRCGGAASTRHGRRHRSQGGLGIGLCLVQRLVQLHAGTVEVRSVPGEGSEFVVRLPVMQS